MILTAGCLSRDPDPETSGDPDCLPAADADYCTYQAEIIYELNISEELVLQILDEFDPRIEELESVRTRGGFHYSFYFRSSLSAINLAAPVAGMPLTEGEYSDDREFPFVVVGSHAGFQVAYDYPDRQDIPFTSVASSIPIIYELAKYIEAEARTINNVNGIISLGLQYHTIVHDE